MGLQVVLASMGQLSILLKPNKERTAHKIDIYVFKIQLDCHIENVQHLSSINCHKIAIYMKPIFLVQGIPTMYLIYPIASIYKSVVKT